MTLHLTLLTPYYVCQVSDRLVTRTATQAAFDRSSNKNLIYRARDATVVLGYSGPAFLEGLPTDRWIAEKLRGEDLTDPPGMKGAIMMGRAPRWLDIGQSVELLRSEFEGLFKKTGMRMGLYVVVAGWQKSGRERQNPILWQLYNNPPLDIYDSFQIERQPRRWHLEGDYPVKLAYAPEPWIPRFSQFSQDELAYLLNHLSMMWLSPRNVIGVLREAVRRKSRVSPVVGADCMCISFPHPRLGFIEAVYVGEGYHQGSFRTESERKVTFRTGYSPWIIGPNEVFPPMAITGQYSHQLGDIEVRLIGPQHSANSGPRVMTAMMGIDRPLPPGSRR